MFKKDMKVLLKINAFMDNEMKKLYDILENQKCCIKRQDKLLLRWKNFFSDSLTWELVDDELRKLIADTNRELSYPMYRVYERRKK